MSVLATMQFLPDPMASAPRRQASDSEDVPAPSWLDAAMANWRLNEDDSPEHVQARKVAAYADLGDALAKRGYDPARYVQRAKPGAQMEAWARTWADVEAERRRDPRAFADIPAGDQQDFEAWAAGRKGQRARDMATAARGGLGTALLPGLAYGLVTGFQPENLPFMAMGGGAKSASQFVMAQALAGAQMTAIQAPEVARARAAAGEAYTPGQLGTDMVTGAAANVAIGGAITYGPPLLAKALKIPRWQRTPTLQAAINVAQHAEDVEATNPFGKTVAGVDAHIEKLTEATAAIEARQVKLEPTATRPVLTGDAGGDPIGAYMRAAGQQESGGRDTATNPNSTASGRYGFTNGTWTAWYRRVFPSSGLSEAAIIARKTDGATADRVMRAMTEHNATWLQGRGEPVTPGNLYVLHHLGEGGASKVFEAAPTTAMSAVLSPEVMAVNPHLRGMTTGQFIAWADRRMGGDGSTPGLAAIDIPEPATVRPEALDAVRPQVTFEGRDVPLQQFSPADIGVDAQLMQFKSGGDQFGVTERLQGVQQWDPMAAGVVTVWEANDGRRLIADGHQRLGLARRIQAADPAQDVRLNAFVLREADGVTAADARVITALKNIAEDQRGGKALDTARVFREIGIENAPEILARLPPKSSMVRDGKALARLSPEAFGAAVNEVIPENYAAAIGHLADDPATHAGLVALLNKINPPNRAQAESIIRQAIDAGFHREEQIDMFGSSTQVTALFAQKARLLDKTLGELRRLKGAFSVAARNADALDAAGNRIDIDASTAAAEGNARALDLVNRLALRKGNAVSAIFNTAAERLARGDGIGDVTRDVVRQLSDLDLASILRESELPGGAGDAAGGGGRGSIADNADGAAPESLSPATRDELEAAGQGGFALFDEEASKAFDDPRGEAIKAVADSAWHDAKAAVATGQARSLETAKSDQLATHASVMWRETDLKRAEEFLPGASFADNGIGGNADVFLADTPTMALGQGVNKGVMLEFSTADLKGKINKKPGWDHQYLTGQGSEFVANNPGAKYQAALRSIEISRDALAEAEALNAKFDYAGTGRRTGFLKSLDDLEAAGWVKTETENGVKYTKPAAPALDNGAAVDPNIAAKTRQEADIAAQQPLTGARKTGVAQDPAMPEGLFGGPQEPTFDLGDGKGARTIADIEGEIDADEAAIEAIKGCLL